MLIADGKATYPVIGADVDDAGDLAGVQLTRWRPTGRPTARVCGPGTSITRIDGRAVSASEELIVADTIAPAGRPGHHDLRAERSSSARRRVTLGSREG